MSIYESQVEMKPGELFAHGKYTLLRRLRSSGMAEIWLARQHGTEGFAKDVVIKRILPHLAEEQKLVSMFLDEAKIAGNLNHPNVVQIYDLGSDGMNYFIAMEYIQGYDLEQIVEQLRKKDLAFPVEFACRMIADACHGLAYAHNCISTDGQPMHVVHRDVSPQNILVSKAGVVKLIDFGIAKAQTSTTRTQHGHTKGKICYMSPEQMMAKELDLRSDIFSAGVVLYEMLTGKKPFEGENLLACFHKLMKEGIDNPKAIRPDLHDDIVRIVMQSMEKDRDLRYPTCNTMRQDLELFMLQNGYVVGPEKIADFLEWLFSDSPSTQFASDLLQKSYTPFSALNKVTSSPRLSTDLSDAFSDPFVQKMNSSHSIPLQKSNSFSFDEDTGFSPQGTSFSEDSEFGSGNLSALINSDTSDERFPPSKNSSSLFLFLLSLIALSIVFVGIYIFYFSNKSETKEKKDSHLIQIAPLPENTSSFLKDSKTKQLLKEKNSSTLPKLDEKTKQKEKATTPKVVKKKKTVKKETTQKKKIAKKKKKYTKKRIAKKKKKEVSKGGGYGHLIIDTNQAARVWLNGDYIEVPLLSKKKIKAGTYNLRFIWGNKTKTKTITIQKNQTKEVFVKLN